MPGTGVPRRAFRLRKALVGELITLADRQHVTLSAYVRFILEQHVLAETKNMGVRHPFRRLDRAVKRFILAYQQGVVTIAGGLPGKPHRTALEELTWKSLGEAIVYAKTQSDPELRLLSMRVVTALMRTELAILREQDAAEVDELFRELEERRREYVEKATQRAQQGAHTE
jgi:hypothetical protein